MSRISVSKPGNQQIAPCSPGISGVAQKLHCFCTYLCKALHYFPLILALLNWSPNMISQFNILKIYYAFHFIFTAAYCMGRNPRKHSFFLGIAQIGEDSPAHFDFDTLISYRHNSDHSPWTLPKNLLLLLLILGCTGVLLTPEQTSSSWSSVLETPSQTPRQTDFSQFKISECTNSPSSYQRHPTYLKMKKYI